MANNSEETIVIKATLRATRDTTAHWNEHPYFVPKLGEIIVYMDRFPAEEPDGVPVPGIKIGNGVTVLKSLPFVDGEGSGYEDLLEKLNQHIDNASIHVSSEDRAKWDAKTDFNASYEDEDEVLVMTKS